MFGLWYLPTFQGKLIIITLAINYYNFLVFMSLYLPTIWALLQKSCFRAGELAPQLRALGFIPSTHTVALNSNPRGDDIFWTLEHKACIGAVKHAGNTHKFRKPSAVRSCTSPNLQCFAVWAGVELSPEHSGRLAGAELARETGGAQPWKNRLQPQQADTRVTSGFGASGPRMFCTYCVRINTISLNSHFCKF